MPNWCPNIMTVLGADDDVYDFVTRAIANDPTVIECGDEECAYKSLLNFHAIAPNSGGFRWLGVIELRNVYDGGVRYEFCTADEPPDRFFVEASRRYPNLTFLLTSGGGVEGGVPERKALRAGEALPIEERWLKTTTVDEPEYGLYGLTHLVEEHDAWAEAWAKENIIAKKAR